MTSSAIFDEAITNSATNSTVTVIIDHVDKRIEQLMKEGKLDPGSAHQFKLQILINLVTSLMTAMCRTYVSKGLLLTIVQTDVTTRLKKMQGLF